MILYCAKCKLQISQDVGELQDRKQLVPADGHNYLPQGYYHIADGSNDGIRGMGEIILNLKDLLNTKFHSDSRRLNGCCGLDGLDELNTVCANGHEIGTDCSDCWMPHDIYIPQDKVRIKR